MATQSGRKVYIQPIILRLEKSPPIVLSATEIQPISILRIAKPTLQAMGTKVKQNRPEYITTKCPIRSSYCTYKVTIRFSKPELDIRIISVIHVRIITLMSMQCVLFYSYT
uniref:AlNc14C16G1790 protein n=1 Tax=Albugo laibachii Nc14 TaxID=890382 RepID=F0W4B9_9STRA|nr:AlNc14C16G1790 [Albugo laibachii Nc14]|eukprot:CCA15952.1 AlNc14C16G1790 [Albugo laibachii Nc14]